MIEPQLVNNEVSVFHGVLGHLTPESCELDSADRSGSAGKKLSFFTCIHWLCRWWIYVTRH